MTPFRPLVPLSLVAALVACSSGPDGAAPPRGTNGANGNGSRGSPGAPPGVSAHGGAYHVDINQTSTSGLSSGAFMAVQFHVAFSSIMKGAAVFAGGPYSCAQGSLTDAYTHCMLATTAPSVTPYVDLTRQYAAAGTIDDPTLLAGQRVFLFGGADDQTVNPVVMDALESYYASFMPAAAIVYESRHPNTAHTMPTVDYGGTCSVTASPWIGDCGYDGAGKGLAQIYGSLNPPATTLSGRVLSIPQGDFIADPASHSLASTAYAYVPASCDAGETCRVHVAFHGCEQEATGAVGSDFYLHAGYNPWADTNHIIVLYPQTIASDLSPSNAEACWDWWGYDSADYAQKSGPQMAMVRAMVDFFVTGRRGVTTAASGDAGSVAPVADGGSACLRASNVAQVAAGRAYAALGYAYARGSNEFLGTDTASSTSSLEELRAGYFVLCPTL
jgi:poly(3-hydroxybutyrate) depolymerase